MELGRILMQYTLFQNRHSPKIALNAMLAISCGRLINRGRDSHRRCDSISIPGLRVLILVNPMFSLVAESKKNRPSNLLGVQVEW